MKTMAAMKNDSIMKTVATMEVRNMKMVIERETSMKMSIKTRMVLMKMKHKLMVRKKALKFVKEVKEVKKSKLVNELKAKKVKVTKMIKVLRAMIT